VTPTSYLELLATLDKLLGARNTMVDGQIRRYQSGVDKIIVTEAQVSEMQKQLEDLQPKL
jgi:dynein heavy chain